MIEDYDADPGQLFTVAGDRAATRVDEVGRLATQRSNGLEAHPTLSLDEATSIATSALLGAFGDGTFSVPTSWLQLSALSTRSS